MIPNALRAERRWIVAKLETVNGRTTKVPYRADDPSRKASSIDPATWADFETASSVVRSHGLMLGFVLGNGFVGVDFDHCIDAGVIHPWVLNMIDALDSYTETSVSGSGVHVYCRGSLPDGGRSTTRTPVKFEIYDTSRYFVVTGDVIRASELEDRTDALGAVHDAIFGVSGKTLAKRLGFDPNDQRGKENITEFDVPRKLSDEEVLLFAARASNGDKFLSLWRGDLSDYGGDHSSADLALASILMFWCRYDREQADRLFRLSNLVRPKWTNRADYRRRTFDKVAGYEL